MKKLYTLALSLCMVLGAVANPALVSRNNYPLSPSLPTSDVELASSVKKAPAATQGLQYDAEAGNLVRYYNETDLMEITTDYVEEYGELYIDILAGDYTDCLSLLLYVEDTVEFSIIPEGVYPITNTGAAGTARASEGYHQTLGVRPCAYYPLVEQGGQLYITTPMYFMVSGTVTVEYNEMGIPKITVDAVNSNGVTIKTVFEIGGKSGIEMEKTPLKYDATEADGALDYTYGEDAVAAATDKGWYGTLDVEDATSMLALLFVYPEGATADATTTIPVGTYTISDSQAPGTVLASSGVSSTGGLSYSFYGTVDAEGYIEVPIYFLVDGTVTVSEVNGELAVEVNGLNSNGVAVHVVYGAVDTAVEDVTTVGGDITKSLENGQLVIIKNGVKYNATGSVVK